MLDVAKIIGKTWKLEGVKLSLSELDKKQSQFILSATKLTLPKPFNDLSLADIRCDAVIWTQNDIDCRQGRASVKSHYWQSPTTHFAFHISPKLSTFRLDNTRFDNSRLTLNAELKGKDWHIQFDAKQVSQALLEKLLPQQADKITLAQFKQNVLNLSGTISGREDTVLSFDVAVQIKDLTGQKPDGKVAVENLDLVVHLQGKRNNNLWNWQGESELLNGALYIDPVYLEVAARPIVLNAQGTSNFIINTTDIQSFAFLHPDAVRLTGNVEGFSHDKATIDKADIVLQSNTPQGLLKTYIDPFFTESPFSGITLSGDIQANVSFTQQTLTDTAIGFNKLNINDEAGRVGLKNGVGSINWSSDSALLKHSELAWQQLSFLGLPLESAKVKFTSQANHFRLAEKVSLPFLNGSISVDKFSWQGKKQNEPDVSFSGALDNVSLEQLSKALGWTPLSGNISGKIPGVTYRNKVISLAGELLINVFDGTIKVGQLSSSGLFTDFHKITSDVVVENLDLDQLTRKFEFGTITGRLSGFVNKLVLENGHPASFYAWFGTPENDDSSHRISQKAVKNIASIGGGGASDLLSRSFLSFFETFRYDKIGMGCYLHDGVCQMMGLEAEGQGYYLIKGGLLPRIDVVGYNPRVNWDVLVERLGRVAAPENAIIQ